MEYCDVYNVNREKIGVKRRDTNRSSDEYFLAVHVWILDKNNNILIQRRADDKKYDPGKWATTGGFAIKNESSLDTCIRETKEETGIVLDRNKMIKVISYLSRNIHFDVWICKLDVITPKIENQDFEISTAEWITIEQLEKLHFEKGIGKLNSKPVNCQLYRYMPMLLEILSSDII